MTTTARSTAIICTLAALAAVAAAQKPPVPRAVPAYWVFLSTGKDRSKRAGFSQADIEKMQAAHVGNFGDQYDKGKLYTAGPLGDNGFIRGIVVVDGSTMDDVREAFKPDPYVNNGLMDIEGYPWIIDPMRFGTPKVPFKIEQHTLAIFKKGPKWTGTVAPRADALIRLLPGLREQDKSGELALSGPLLDAGDKLGIAWFLSKDQGAVQKLLASLPEVQSGRVAVELHPQYIGAGVLRDPAENVAPPPPGKRISLAAPSNWQGDIQKTWQVRGGTVTGGSLTETVPHNDFLCTVRDYGNFDLRLKVKLTGTGFVNGGIQFRSQRTTDPAYEMVGYQADMGDGYWGSLYDESRRNKVLAHTHAEIIRRILKPNDWNDYVIRCEGKRIRLWLNGVLTVDYTEPDNTIPLAGKIGLQVHGGGKTEASYKGITIQELP
jgi:uncharacterized protein YciI